MSTSDSDFSRQRRRKHSPEFKAKVIAAARRPGVSMSAVAMAHKLNANLLRRWVIAEERNPSPPRLSVKTLPASGAVPDANAFVAIPIDRSSSAQPITVEVQRGSTTVKIAWPVNAAADCATWLRELLR